MFKCRELYLQPQQDSLHSQFRFRQRLPAQQIEAGTDLSVRTNEYIDNDRRDNRIYTGTVDRNVRGGNGRLAIPRGSQVEMIVRTASDGDLILDLESVTVNGQRYALDTNAERIESGGGEGIGQNRRTAEHVGGGALLGTIIGAIAGGGKGAAIGAAAGAAAGAGVQVITRGKRVRVPAESLITFRIDRPMVMAVAERGVDRDGHHYHDQYGGPPRCGRYFPASESGRNDEICEEFISGDVPHWPFL